MKVCVVNPNYYRSSGVTVAIKQISHAMAHLGIDNYFVDCHYGSQGESYDWLTQERLFNFRLMSSNPLVLIDQSLKFVIWIKERQIKIVHVHHRRLASLLYLLQGLGRFRMVYTGHLTYPFALWFWLLSPDLMTAVSESVAKNISETTRAKSIVTISNPVTFPELCPPIPQHIDTAAAICIARLDPVKGHDNLIKAWKILADRGHTYQLHLVGEGVLEGSLRSLVTKLGLDNLIFFKGFINNVQEHIKNYLFAVLVSSVEGLGIVTVEAASCGRASLLTDVDGSRDCIPIGHVLSNGVPYGDVTKLAGALVYCSGHPKETLNEGEIFFHFHKKRSSPDIVGAQYLSVYESTKAYGA
jgi:glycosyltransferase involved in cell wall biosynthesis